jgi:hypothetical protein
MNSVQRADAFDMHKTSPMQCGVQQKARILNHGKALIPVPDLVHNGSSIKEGGGRRPKARETRDLGLRVNLFHGPLDYLTAGEDSAAMLLKPLPVRIGYFGTS